MVRPVALIFDVFGTLVDWRTSIARQVAAAFAAKGKSVDATGFADLWRAQYDPSMDPIRSGSRAYIALDHLHLESLATVLTAYGATSFFTASEQRDLARAWERLYPWPDSAAALLSLRQVALLAPCSNGSIALISRLSRHAAFQWDCVLGAQIAHNYKPHPSVYLASCAALGLPPEQVMMVACHNSDLAAAAALGLQTGFFPRGREHGPNQQFDLAARGDWTIVARDLADLSAILTKAP